MLVYHALVCTCGDAKPIDQGDQTAYKELLYFWEMILQPRTTDPNDTTDLSKLHAILYDGFLSSLLRLVKTFNLDVQKKIENDTQEDTSRVASDASFSIALSKSLEPVNSKDFILFQNLVEFWTLLLPKLENERLLHWIPVAGPALIAQSIQKPLVSGYYRMVSAVLVVTGKSNIFRGFKEVATPHFLELSRDISESQVGLLHHALFNLFTLQFVYID